MCDRPSPVFHTHRGSTYTANDFTRLCRRWCYGFYSHDRRPSAAAVTGTVNYETAAATIPQAA